MKRLLHLIAGAAYLLPVLFAGCGGDSTDDPAPEADYLKISPTTAFTFDEADLSKNAFTVAANADLSWQATASPAQGVSFNRALGSGSGSFTLTDMPAGATVEIYVKHSYADGRPTLESNRVKVTRAQAAVTLTVSPSKLTFDESDATKNSVEIRSNATWKASSPNGDVTFSPAEGTGDGTIRITAAPNGTSTLTVTAGEGEKAVTRNVAISRNVTPPPADPIYRLDFGTGGTGWANQLDDWKTQTGSGAGAVAYSVNNVYINTDGYGSAGRYDGASGGSYAKMFYNADTDYFEVQQIALPAGRTDFRLTFGTICRAADLSLRLSADGRRWKEVSFTGAATYNTWTLAVCDFSLTQPVSQLFIRLQPKGVTQSYGLNFDDITLTASTGGGQQITLEESGPYRWPELPANFEQPAANQAVHTNWATTVRTGKRVRNYTYCYDTQRHNPVWVAYLLHDCYQEGGFTRPAQDPWAPDPSLDAAVQSKIYPAYEGDVYNYYTAATLSNAQMWTRGHLVMSSERGCGDKNNPALLNLQTFYPTNVAPQPAIGTYTFGTAWGYVESLFSGTRNAETEFTADDGATNLNCVADTLFMVAGCYYGDPSLIEKDASSFGNLLPTAKDCAMPTHQFKLALRTKKGDTGKRIQECEASELQAIGFWIPTYMTDAVTSGQIDRFAYPVAEIERRTGLTFFPEVPAEVKASFNRTEWGF